MVYSTGSKTLPVFLFRFLKHEKAAVAMTAALSVFRLLLGRSADRAGLGAGAAFDADFGVDLILAVAFADGGNGTFSGTGTAADAFFGNLVSHWETSS